MEKEDQQAQNPGNPDSGNADKNMVPPKPPPGEDPSKTHVFPFLSPLKDEKGTAPGTGTGQVPPTVPEIEEKPFKVAALWKSNPLLVVIAVAIGFVLLLFILKMIVAMPGKSRVNVVKPAAAEEQIEEVRARQPLPQVTKPEVESWQYQEVTDGAFWGKAAVQGPGVKSIFSTDQDVEVAAIVAALKNHVEIISGSKTAKWRNGVRKSVIGTWLDFKISYNETVIPDREPTSETLVTTPDKVNIRCQDNRLVSMKNSDAEKFKQELTDAGITLIKNPGKQESGLVYIRLVPSAFAEIPSEFLITSDRVGILKVGSTVSNMESLFPANYIFGTKRVILGKQFYNIHKIHDQQQTPLLFVYDLNGRIIGISPINERYRTVKNIGIGSSLAEALVTYGKVNFGFLPGKQTVAKLEGINAQFFFEEQKLDFKNNVFSPEARIESILIGEAPSGEEKL